MRLKALMPHTVSAKLKVRRGDVFEVSKELGERLVRMQIAEPTKAKVSVSSAAGELVVQDRDFQIGDLVNVELDGVLQLAEPAPITRFDEKDGERFAFVKGSRSGVPVSSLTLVQS